MQRPTESSIEYHEAAEELAKELAKWSGDESHEEHLDAAKACFEEFDNNGFELAKMLDDRYHYFKVDASLVELLDTVSTMKHEAAEKAVKKWVQWEQIKPALALGQRVKIKTYHEGKYAECEGEITKIYEETAQYQICVEAHGHVKEGLGTYGYVKNYEDVQPAEEVKNARR